MKRYLLLFALLFTGLPLNAENYLIFKQKNGWERSLPLSDLVIKFQNGQMQASSGAEAFSLDLETMQSLFFSTRPSAIETVQTDDVRKKNMQIYDLDGRRVNTFDGCPQGVYIVKEGDATRKILVK